MSYVKTRNNFEMNITHIRRNVTSCLVFSVITNMLALKVRKENEGSKR